jgi:hypothetical protein
MSNCLYVGRLYSNKTAESQNQFLARHIIPYSPNTRRPRKDTPRNRTQNQYFMHKKDGGTILLCATAFQNITSVKRKRLNNISLHLLEHGESPTERRGGARLVEKRSEIRQSIIGHIKSFPVQQSHYSRHRSCRQYLASHLSVAKMYKLWLEKRVQENLATVKYCTYRKIFRKKFQS